MAQKLTQVIRLDSLPLDQTYYTDEGYLIDRPVLTSTGIFEYTNDDGQVRRELRLPEDVFAPDSLKSYQGKPIIITHSAGMVDKDNVKDYQIGTILTEGYRSGNDVRAKVVIHDTRAMKNCGLKELSLGYRLDLDETPGVWHGQPYDAVQHNISINHLALVREARAGDQARLNIDSRDGKTFKGGRKMENTKRTDGMTPEQVQEAIREYLEKHAEEAAPVLDEETQETPVAEPEEEPVVTQDAEGEVQETEDPEATAAPEPPADITPADTMPMTLEQQIGAIKERNPEPDEDLQLALNILDRFMADKAYDEANKAAPKAEPKPAQTDSRHDGTAESIADAIFCQRMKIAKAARKLNLDGVEYMPMRAAKRAIILADTPNIRLDGKNDVYLDALFDRVFAGLEQKSRVPVEEQARQMFNPATAVRADGAESKESAASKRQAMIQRQYSRK